MQEINKRSARWSPQLESRGVSEHPHPCRDLVADATLGLDSFTPSPNARMCLVLLTTLKDDAIESPPRLTLFLRSPPYMTDWQDPAVILSEYCASVFTREGSI